MANTGKLNSITDVPGILVGNYTDAQAMSGTTVVVCPQSAVGGVEVRGSAPGTRETDLLRPENLVQKVQAVLLTGGSVFGLAAADGVVRWLEGMGWGFPLEDGHVAPIVPGACLFDLGRGPDFRPPVGPDWGKAACNQANGKAVPLGCVGAGTGALSGGVKGGLGSASVVMDDGVTVGALVAVNSLGTTLDPASGRFWEERLAIGGELGPEPLRAVAVPPQAVPQAGRNTTLALVATDAVLDKVQARKIAGMAHNGLARAIRPAHTMYDGDTVFCLSTCGKPLAETPGFFASPNAAALTMLGYAAADCLSRAIMRAIVSAASTGGLTAWADLPDFS